MDVKVHRLRYIGNTPEVELSIKGGENRCIKSLYNQGVLMATDEPWLNRCLDFENSTNKPASLFGKVRPRNTNKLFPQNKIIFRLRLFSKNSKHWDVKFV